LVDQQQQLLNQNSDLRQQLLLLQASAPSTRRLRLLPLPGRRVEPAPEAGAQQVLNPGDDGPPTAVSAGPTHK
jgi:hypothetical protein